MSRILTLDSAAAAGRDFVSHVAGMTGGKATLTGEFPDVYVLDHLLQPHYGTENPSPELKDFALSAGVYLSLWLGRFWASAELAPYWRNGDLTECGMGAAVTAPGGESLEFFVACPSHVMGFVQDPPNPFPQFAGSWMTPREGDPLLPRYLLGAALLSQPLAEGTYPQAAPGEGPLGPAHLRFSLDLLARSCARDVEPTDGVARRILEDLYEAVLWPPVGAFGNDYGTENLRVLAGKIADAGPENLEAVRGALASMERGWTADGSYLAGLILRALDGREDLPEERLGFHVPEVRDVLNEASKILERRGLRRS
ncbi:MAG: hypothetical protein ACOYXN_08515 [Acidobacteriota bacterium]